MEEVDELDSKARFVCESASVPPNFACLLLVLELQSKKYLKLRAKKNRSKLPEAHLRSSTVFFTVLGITKDFHPNFLLNNSKRGVCVCVCMCE